MLLRTRRHANERIAVLAALGTASVFCVLLEGFREFHYRGDELRFMLWNLILAWVPLVLALLVYDRYRMGAPVVRLVPWAILWLLFLPNAPYTMTDFVHLAPGRLAPLWYDGVLLSAFGWTGLLLGFVSIYLIHAVARHRFGARAAWYGVVASFALASVGVYLGRFQRWNSWDLLVQPGKRFGQMAAQLTDPVSLARATVLTLALTCLLTAAYLSFYALVGVRLNPEPRR